MSQIVKINGVRCSIENIDAYSDNVRVGFLVGSTVKELADKFDSDVAFNFNFANNTLGVPIGRVISDGKEVNSDITKTVARDEFYMLGGRFYIGKAPKGATQAVQGSPRLMRGGLNVIKETIERDDTGVDIWRNNAKHIRVAIGVIDEYRAVLVRTHDSVTLDVLFGIMKSLGCVDALNGDGGGSAYHYPVNTGWGRKMGSAILINKGVKSVKQVDLIIDAGHGGVDPGASGNGIIEKNMTLDISLYQLKRFRELGVNVLMTRETDVFLDSEPRADFVKDSKAIQCISNHINSASATSAKGVEVIHSLSNNGKFASLIVSELQKAGQVLRTTPTFSKANSNGRDFYYMHRLTGAVTVNIVEYGFCSNAEDAERLKKNWRIYAEAVVKAYCLFTGVKYVAPKVEVSSDVKMHPVYKDLPANHYSVGAIDKLLKNGVKLGISENEIGLGIPIDAPRLIAILNKLGLLD